MSRLLETLKRLGSHPSGRPGKGWLRVYPFELYTWVVLLASVAFLRARGLRMDWQTVEYTIGPMFKMLPMVFLLGIGLQLVYQALRAGTWGGEPATGGAGATGARFPSQFLVRLRGNVVGYLRQVFSLAWLVLWFRLWFACMLMTYVYFWVKVCIPLIRHDLWDPLLWRLDRGLHFGFSPSLFAVELFEGSFLVSWIDLWYGLWIGTVIWSMAFFCAAQDSSLRRSFAFSCCLLWTLGSWIYMSLPAMGPVYTAPEVWRDLLEHMPNAEGGQALLRENYDKMLQGRSGTLRQFNPTRGIAALPSLHVGAHWLFALWLRRTLRPLFVVGLLATLVTLVGSVLTGWHYAVDGYAGILLAYVCYRVAVWLERPPAAEEPAEDSEETDPASPPQPTVPQPGA